MCWLNRVKAKKKRDFSRMKQDPNASWLSRGKGKLTRMSEILLDQDNKVTVMDRRENGRMVDQDGAKRHKQTERPGGASVLNDFKWTDLGN